MRWFLRGKGVQRRHRVAILLPDCPEFVVAFLGVVWMGAVAVPIHEALGARKAQLAIDDSEASVLITTQQWRERLEQLESGCVQVVSIDAKGDFLRELEGYPQENAVETSMDEPAFWLYTSGSTGVPKGVIHAHFSPIYTAESFGRRTLGLRDTDTVFSVSRLAAAYGLGVGLYTPLYVGATTVLTAQANAFDVIEALERFRPSVFCAIPSTFSELLQLHEVTRFSTGTLRLCVSAGERLPSGLWRKWRDRFGLDICEGIGSSETHHFISNRPGQCKPGTCGLPTPGYELHIVDEDGVSLPRCREGLIEVECPAVCLGYGGMASGYWMSPRKQRFRTGDRFVCDSDGYYRFLGRQDDAVKVRGTWVYPSEVEEVLSGHDKVAGVVVVGRADESGDGLTELVAFVCLTPGSERETTLLSLRSFLRSRLRGASLPRKLVVMDDFPRGATGKADRRKLSEMRECATW